MAPNDRFGSSLHSSSLCTSEPPFAQQKPVLTPETRGDIFMARKMYREAIETFREGLPKDPVLLNKIGIAYHQMMQLDNARKSYEQALKLKPNYVEAMNNLGTVYYAQKSFRRAISWYNKALKVAPEGNQIGVHLHESRHRLVRPQAVREGNRDVSDGA